MAGGRDERMTRLEHRMDLMLARIAHHDKRLDDLIVNIAEGLVTGRRPYP